MTIFDPEGLTREQEKDFLRSGVVEGAHCVITQREFSARWSRTMLKPSAEDSPANSPASDIED